MNGGCGVPGQAQLQRDGPGRRVTVSHRAEARHGSTFTGAVGLGAWEGGSRAGRGGWKERQHHSGRRARFSEVSSVLSRMMEGVYDFRRKVTCLCFCFKRLLAAGWKMGLGRPGGRLSGYSPPRRLIFECLSSYVLENLAAPCGDVREF